MSKYSEFKNLLNKFVQQANINIKRGAEKKTKLSGIEKTYPAVTIDGIDYKIQMFIYGSGTGYGPKEGRGSVKAPYFSYELNSDFWVNVRIKFENFEVKTLKIVKWNSHTNKDVETILEVDISDLNLDSTSTSNKTLEKFYDQFISFKKGSKMKKEQNVVEEPSSNYIGDSKYAQVLKNSKNLIFRGAPGTGKTYLAKQIAEELTGGNEEQIGFVQFHPSYDYTDFVEGLRPVSDKGQVLSCRTGFLKSFVRKQKKIQIKNSSSLSTKSTAGRFPRFLVNCSSLLTQTIAGKREPFQRNMPIYMKRMRNFISLKMSILSAP